MGQEFLPFVCFAGSVFLLMACGDGGSSATGGAGGAGGSGGGGDAGIVVDRGPTGIPLDGDANGLFWDAAGKTLYIADDNGNRILKWTDESGISLAADLPPGPPNSPGLGQVVRMADGTLVIPRFGGGFAGDVVYAKPDGTNGVVPNLDPIRRRIGLTVAEDGALYDTYFVAMNGVKLGAVAKLDLAGSEVDVIGSLKKPVGVLAVGADLVAGDQEAGLVLRAPAASPADQVVIAQIPTPDLLCDGPNGTFFTGGKDGSVRQIIGGGKWSDFASGFQEVRGVAYDAENGRLFIADHDPVGTAHFLRILPVE